MDFFKKKEKPLEKEVFLVMNETQFEQLSAQVRANTAFCADPLQQAYNMGMLHVLGLLREGFVVKDKRN